MIKQNDKVYHVYNMSLKGVVEWVQQEASQVYMSAGPTQPRLFAYVRTADNKSVRIPVEELMRDD